MSNQRGIIQSLPLLIFAALGVILYITVASTVDFSQNPLFSKLFSKPSSLAQGPSAEDEILLKFKPGVSDQAKEKILNSHALQKIDSIPQIEVELTKVPPEAKDKVIEALNKNPLVEYAEPNFLGELLYEPNDPGWLAGSAQWGLKKIGGAASWDITKGSPNVPIAISDSGMMITHEDLIGKALDPWNVVTGTPDVTDGNGHGTEVSGVAAALTDNGKGIAALDWLNPIIPIKIISADGKIWYSDGTKSIIYAADHGAKAINMSWGGSSSSLTMQDAINYAWGKGVVLAAASGNSGTLGVLFPARANNVIAVGASDGNDLKANFSTYGPELDVVAPGVGIYGTAINGSYVSASGTSFSTPFVASLVALIFSANPNLTNLQVVDIITSTALDKGDPGWDQYYGWGRIQADKALQKASGITPPPPDTTTPTTSITQPTGGSTVSGVLDITADASDNIGVTKVEFYVDGILHATDTISPYLASWDTTTYANTSHNLQTKAYDLAGNVGNSQLVTVTVSNPTPTPTPTPNPTPSPTSIPNLQLSGRITDSSINTPIAGASVKVTISGSKGKSAQVGSTTTDINGDYILNLNQNSYTVEANAPGYQKQSQTINFTSSTTLNFSLTSTSQGKGTNK